jgi:hypothetical protein
MELDITQFFSDAAPMDYSASQAEIGASAGADTWRAACDDSEDYPLVDTDEKRDAFRTFVRSSGGWNDDEINAWSDTELNALCLQWVAGDMRECGIGPDSSLEEWQEVRQRQEAGNLPSRLYRGADGRVYFSLEG